MTLPREVRHAYIDSLVRAHIYNVRITGGFSWPIDTRRVIAVFGQNYHYKTHALGELPIYPTRKY
jgi:hypothetical protein